MATAGVPARPTKTVLIVEDNAIAREGMAVVLFRHGYHALTAGHGREALELLASGPTPDLILLDRLMPVLDGWKLLDRLKAGRYSAIPVVITTGTILTPEWAAGHGAAGFLKKPVEENDLLAEVKRCLGPLDGGRSPGQACGAGFTHGPASSAGRVVTTRPAFFSR